MATGEAFIADIKSDPINFTVVDVLLDEIKVDLVTVGTELLKTDPYLNSINPDDSCNKTWTCVGLYSIIGGLLSTIGYGIFKSFHSTMRIRFGKVPVTLQCTFPVDKIELPPDTGTNKEISGAALLIPVFEIKVPPNLNCPFEFTENCE